MYEGSCALSFRLGFSKKERFKCRKARPNQSAHLQNVHDMGICSTDKRVLVRSGSICTRTQEQVVALHLDVPIEQKTLWTSDVY